MPMTRYKQEQIVNLLRQIEAEIATGKTTPQDAALGKARQISVRQSFAPAPPHPRRRASGSIDTYGYSPYTCAASGGMP
jgi:hypothetical protein